MLQAEVIAVDRAGLDRIVTLAPSKVRQTELPGALLVVAIGKGVYVVGPSSVDAPLGPGHAASDHGDAGQGFGVKVTDTATALPSTTALPGVPTVVYPFTLPTE